MSRVAEGPSPDRLDLIVRYFTSIAGSGGIDILDDAALVELTPGKSLAFTQGSIACGVDFYPDDPPDTVAAKALRTNLADIAAKGVMPAAFSISLGLPDDWQESWLAAFSRGIAAECRDYRVKLARSSAFRAPGGPVVSIAAWGETDPAHYRSRFGASPGDRLYVTGTLGDAALGERVRMSDRDFYQLRGAATLLTHYLKPRPPLSFAPLIARFASASLNLTGGLLSDLQDLARASRVSFEVDGRRLPFSAAVREAFSIGDVMQLALTGRGDYQFLFTVPEELVSPFRAAAGTQRVEISEIGKAADGAGEVSLRNLANITLPARA